eukprot:3161892-Pleurochrysis_carterae.AAC.1
MSFRAVKLSHKVAKRQPCVRLPQWIVSIHLSSATEARGAHPGSTCNSCKGECVIRRDRHLGALSPAGLSVAWTSLAPAPAKCVHKKRASGPARARVLPNWGEWVWAACRRRSCLVASTRDIARTQRESM